MQTQTIIYQGSGVEIEVRLDALVSLDKVFEDGIMAVRDLDTEHVARLVETQLQGVPAIKVAHTSAGEVIVDGRHREAAARLLKRQTIRAIEGIYSSEAGIIEAAFQANLTHGVPLNNAGRANYVLWLYWNNPTMSQTEMARKVGISQAAVSKIIKKFIREEKPGADSPTYEARSFVQRCVAAIESLPFDEKRTYEQDCRLYARFVKEYIDSLETEKRKRVESYLGEVADVLRYARYI